MVASQIQVTGSEAKPKSQSKSKEAIHEYLHQLIQRRDEQRLSAFLSTVRDHHPNDVDDVTLENAQGILQAWKYEAQLQDFCLKTDFTPDELDDFKELIDTVEEYKFKAHIHNMIRSHAKSRYDIALRKQAIS